MTLPTLATALFILTSTLAGSAGGLATSSGPIELPERFGFETDSLDGWQSLAGPVRPSLHCRRDQEFYTSRPMQKIGQGFLSTLDDEKGESNDSYRVTLESPVFILETPGISFLVAGGQARESVRVALCDAVTGKELLAASGQNDQLFRPVRWDNAGLVGKPLFMKLVDQAEGGWGHLLLDHVCFAGHIDAAATAKHRIEARRQAIDDEIGRPALQAAIVDLEQRFPGQYQGWSAKLAELQNLPAETPDLLQRFRDFKRKALLANPLVSGRPILYVQRRQYKVDHHNTETLFQANEIAPEKYDPPGMLKSIDLQTGLIKTLVDGGPESLARDPEVDFDGGKIIFAMRRNRADSYHLYEVNADGYGLHQLTRAKDVSDIDPAYLPDGQVIFTSTREPKYCMCNRHIMGNLFRMERDGANIHQIGRSTLFEGHASLMPDGRILYDRWEYVDRNFGDAQGLWVVNPDGTRHAIYWGNNTTSPGAVLDGHVLQNGLCLCTFSSCHDRPWGAIALVDRRRGVDGREPVVRTWPASAVDLVDRGDFDTFSRVSPRYEDPFPLDDHYFLASRATGNGEEMAIVLLDTFGNEIEIHRDAPGCFDPMPLGPRIRPPAIPLARTYDDAPGLFYVQNVYVGTHMQGVKPGSVKWLRVVESGEKRSWNNNAWTGQTGYAPGTQWPATNWSDLGTKRILGTVPVEADGSAYFECPPGTFVFFQLLDDKGRLVQTMRSGTIIQPGERQGCIGCHENRVGQPPASGVPAALGQRPHQLQGWHSQRGFFSFARDVQPVFDRYCVQCHDFGKPAGEKLLLCGDRGLTFSASYKDLWRRGLTACLGTGKAEIPPPYAWGSNRSRLVAVLDQGHRQIKLTPEEFDAIVSWIDLNGPYYPTYDCAYPENLAGRCPLSNAELQRLGKLTGIHFPNLTGYGQSRGALVSFDRPELSPCLAKIPRNGPEYREILAILQAGQARLKVRPEADRPGFIPAETVQRREEFYVRRQAAEKASRQAILENRKVYDAEEAPRETP